jgi:hypothetical protein
MVGWHCGRDAIAACGTKSARFPILRNRAIRFFRNRPVPAENENPSHLAGPRKRTARTLSHTPVNSAYRRVSLRRNGHPAVRRCIAASVLLP